MYWKQPLYCWLLVNRERALTAVVLWNVESSSASSSCRQPFFFLLCMLCEYLKRTWSFQFVDDIYITPTPDLIVLFETDTLKNFYLHNRFLLCKFSFRYIQIRDWLTFIKLYMTLLFFFPYQCFCFSVIFLMEYF